MRSKIRYTITILALFGFIWVMPGYSNAGVNDIKQSLKKDKVFSQNKTEKPVSETQKPYKNIITRKSLENTANQIKNIFFKPPKSTKKAVPTVSSPRRISGPIRIKDDDEEEPIPPINLPTPASFGLPQATSEAELSAQAELELFYNGLSGGGLDPSFADFCSRRANFPYLCAIARYYDFENRLYKLYGSNVYKGMEEYEVGLQAVDIYSKYPEDKICRNVVEKINDEITKIAGNDEQLKKEISDFNARLENFKTKITAMVKNFNENTFEGPLTESDFYFIVNNYRDLIRSGYGSEGYGKVLKAYFNLRDYNGAKECFNNMLKVYEWLPTTFDIKYQTPPDTQIQTLNIKIDKTGPASLGGRNYDLNSELCTTIKDEYISNALRYSTVSDSGEKIHKEMMPLVDKYGKNTAPWMNMERNIDKIYFTRQEKFEVKENEVIDTTDVITIRANASNYNNSASLYPFIINVNSSVSKRSKALLLKRDFFYGDYFNTFKINENNDLQDKSKNLINDGKNSNIDSISVLNGFDEQTEGKDMFYSKYFDKKLLYANHTTTSIDLEKHEIIPTSEQFCKAGGGEIIFTDNKTANLDVTTAAVVVSHQAKWMMLEGHGDILDGSIQYGLSNNKSYKGIIKPQDAQIFYNKNTEILILNACYCLQYGKDDDNNKEYWAKLWHQMLPIHLILGYHGSPNPLMPQEAIKNFANELSNLNGKKLTKSEIGYLWLSAHLDFYLHGSFIYRNDHAIYARYVFNDNNSSKYKYWFISAYKPNNTVGGKKWKPSFIDYIEIEEGTN